MENKNAFMTQIRYFAFLILCGGITVLLYLAAVGNTDQVYQDVIVSNYVSKTSDNKSIEMYLLYFLIFAGIMCCALFYFRQQKSVQIPRIQSLQTEQRPVTRTILQWLCLLLQVCGIVHIPERI